jgi:hypothetical protein
VFFEPGADIAEFLVFPAGKHDDDVDTASLIGRAVDQAPPAKVKGQETRKPPDMWSTPDSSGGDWKVA